jgi:hypothetical protein
MQVDRALTLKQKMFARYVSELALVEYQMLQFKASLVSASCVCLAKLVVVEGKNKAADPWPAHLAHESGYSLAELQPCVNVLNMVMLADKGHITPVPENIVIGSELGAVRDKYTHQKRLFIATGFTPVHNLETVLQLHVERKAAGGCGGGAAAAASL